MTMMKRKGRMGMGVSKGVGWTEVMNATLTLSQVMCVGHSISNRDYP